MMNRKIMIVNTLLINEDRYSEIEALDELMRELQNETLNEDWGYWHFSLLNLEQEEDLERRLHKTLYAIPQYQKHTDLAPGSEGYNSLLDLKNLRLLTVCDLRQEIIAKAEDWSTYQGPSSDPKTITEKFHDLKYVVADKLAAFLKTKDIVDMKRMEGIDTCYTFGGDHCGDDLLVETKAGVYVIHFGFSI